jgi:hypothetical protein
MHTGSGPEVKDALWIGNWGQEQFASGEHEIDVMCEIHAVLLMLVVGL